MRLNGNRSSERVHIYTYYRYFFFARPGEFSTHLLSGQLFQQFVVDLFGSIDQDRLHWISQHQKQIRSELYKLLNEVLTRNGNPQEIGKAVILPSSYTGGPRYM
jgi:hypothetical protein